MLVDQPSFFDILDDAHDVCNEGDTTCDDNRAFYPFTIYIMFVIIAMVMPITLFGCCGAMKKSNCLLGLGTYLMTKYAKIVQKHQLTRTLVHLFVILVLIIAIFDKGFSVNFEDTVKTPFEKALKKYNDQPAEEDQSAQNYKSVWNEVQAEVRRNCDGEMERGRLTHGTP